MSALQLQGILDTPPEKTFDGITRAVAAICETPIALVTFVDRNRQWFKSCLGLNVSETSRDVAFCAHAILTPNELMEVEDATRDPRFRDNSLVNGSPNIRFYAGMPLTTPNGHALGTLCVIDLKPRVLTTGQREALRQLAGTLSSLMEERTNSSAISRAIEKNVTHGALVTDARLPGYPVVYTNQGYEKLTQLTRVEVIGNSCPDLHGDDTDLTTLDKLNQAVADQQECIATVKCYRKDGTDFWNEITITPVKNSNDETTHFLHIHRDVSARYAAEQQQHDSHELLEHRVEQRTTELRDSEERYRQLFEHAGDLIHCIDMNGEFIYVNPAWHQTTGYNAEELAGLTLFDVVHPDDHAHCRDRLERAVAGDQIGTVETTFVTKSGQRIRVEGSISCQFKDGNPIAARGIFHNITARVAAAESLQQAKVVAENNTEAQSKFLAAASHDLRQPLAAIGIYLAVLERQLVDPKDLQVSSHIRESLNATRELLDALLDISSLRSGTVQPRVEEFSPHKMFEQLRVSNEPLANEKHLSLHFELPECAIQSDPALLKRILENLIVNAIRYTETGRIDVRCRSMEDHARIEVTDTGIGIAAEHMDDIFGEYVQLDNDVRDRRNGLGLGLSIVKYVAQLLGHHVTATSTPGVGSCFVVEVPRSLTIPYEDQSEFSLPTVEKRQLLLVEDNPAVLAATEMLFLAAGHCVYTANDSQGALAHLAHGVTPDVLVSDYRLPGMNGLELAARVREAAGCEVPVVLITGDTSVTTTNLRHCEVLHKPVDSNALLALLQVMANTAFEFDGE